jgi:hypothetical protein
MFPVSVKGKQHNEATRQVFSTQSICMDPAKAAAIKTGSGMKTQRSSLPGTSRGLPVHARNRQPVRLLTTFQVSRPTTYTELAIYFSLFPQMSHRACSRTAKRPQSRAGQQDLNANGHPRCKGDPRSTDSMDLSSFVIVCRRRGRGDGMAAPTSLPFTAPTYSKGDMKGASEHAARTRVRPLPPVSRNIPGGPQETGCRDMRGAKQRRNAKK